MPWPCPVASPRPAAYSCRSSSPSHEIAENRPIPTGGVLPGEVACPHDHLKLRDVSWQRIKDLNGGGQRATWASSPTQTSVGHSMREPVQPGDEATHRVPVDDRLLKTEDVANALRSSAHFSKLHSTGSPPADRPRPSGSADRIGRVVARSVWQADVLDRYVSCCSSPW
jgi:hypothetical protein